MRELVYKAILAAAVEQGVQHFFRPLLPYVWMIIVGVAVVEMWRLPEVQSGLVPIQRRLGNRYRTFRSGALIVLLLMDYALVSLVFASSVPHFELVYNAKPLNGQMISLRNSPPGTTPTVMTRFVGPPEGFATNGLMAIAKGDGPSEPDFVQLRFHYAIEKWQGNSADWVQLSDASDGSKVFSWTPGKQSVNPEHPFAFPLFIAKPVPQAPIEVETIIAYGDKQTKAAFTIKPF